jgi:NAD(P)-dependent dehydrogenase (short-subunit alcohol dehydrogenase family)
MSQAPTLSLAGKVVIVTGAGRGNGRAMAEGLAGLGAEVVGVDRDFQGVPTAFAAETCDLTDEAALEDIVARRLSSGRIDGLVNNAGVSLPPQDCYSTATFETTIAINTLAPLRLSWHVAEAMKAQGAGSIVNITSLGSHLGFPDNPAYQASKAALLQITRAMAVDYGKFGVRVNSLCPGYIVTDMTKASYGDPEKRKARADRMALNRWGQPEDLVGPCAFLLSSASAYVTGIDLAVDGGWMAKGL